MSAAEDLTRALKGDWHGSYGSIPTPGHSSRDRGTTIRDRADGEGVVVNAFNGDPDAWKAVQDEGRRLGIIAQIEKPERSEGWRVTGVYEFTDTDGTVLYRTQRLERSGRPKRFAAQRADGKGGWLDKLGEVPRVLYRLHEIAAADPATPVYLVEGERKADKLASWGFVATAVAFGARGWRDSYAEALAGRSVVILPDNDEEGRGFAERAASGIQAAGGKPIVLELPNLPPKGDIVDWRGTADDLRALTDAALNPPPELLPLIDPADWSDVTTPAREWAVNDWIPARQATYLTGPGSAGKSLLSQQLATCIALGLPFMGVETRQTRAVYLTCEDDADELHRRHKAICEGLGFSSTAARGKLSLVSLVGSIGNELATFTPDGRMATTAGWQRLRDTVLALGVGFVVLDNVAHLFAGNENIRNQVAAFVGLLNSLAQEAGASVLLLGHPNKAGDAFSGSTAWENQVRSRLFMAVPRGDGMPTDRDARELSREKANYARNGETIAFRWHRGAFVRDSDLPLEVIAELAANAEAATENAAFLKCLALATEQRRNVSHVKGSNYAPTIFARMTEAAGMTPAAFERAMERVLSLGLIQLDQPLWNGPDRHPRRGIKALSECGNPPAVTPCGDLREPLAEKGGNAAVTPRAGPPLYTTYKTGAAHGAAAPSREEKKPDLSRIIFPAEPSARRSGPILAPGESPDDPVPGWQ